MTAKPLDEITMTTKVLNSWFNNCSIPRVHTINTSVMPCSHVTKFNPKVPPKLFCLREKYFSANGSITHSEPEILFSNKIISVRISVEILG